MIDNFLHWSWTILENLVYGDEPLGWRILAAWLMLFVWAFLIDSVVWLLGYGPKDHPRIMKKPQQRLVSKLRRRL